MFRHRKVDLGEGGLVRSFLKRERKKGFPRPSLRHFLELERDTVTEKYIYQYIEGTGRERAENGQGLKYQISEFFEQ